MATDIDINPAAVNLSFRQGTDVDQSLLKFVWKQGGTAVDLDGWGARASFALKAGDSPYFTLSTEDGGIVLNEVDGQIELVAAAADTNALAATLFKAGKLVGVWDLEMISPAGKVRPLAAGVWTLWQDIQHG